MNRATLVVVDRFLGVFLSPNATNGWVSLSDDTIRNIVGNLDNGEKSMVAQTSQRSRDVVQPVIDQERETQIEAMREWLNGIAAERSTCQIEHGGYNVPIKVDLCDDKRIWRLELDDTTHSGHVRDMSKNGSGMEVTVLTLQTDANGGNPFFVVNIKSDINTLSSLKNVLCASPWGSIPGDDRPLVFRDGDLDLTYSFSISDVLVSLVQEECSALTQRINNCKWMGRNIKDMQEWLCRFDNPDFTSFINRGLDVSLDLHKWQLNFQKENENSVQKVSAVFLFEENRLELAWFHVLYILEGGNEHRHEGFKQTKNLTGLEELKSFLVGTDWGDGEQMDSYYLAIEDPVERH